MTKRPLGRSGLEIAPLVFGANVFGWTVDEAGAARLLDRFFGAGLNAIDTADVYSKWVPGNRGGESETIIGRWLQSRPGRRKDAVLITKVGSEIGRRKGLSARHILSAVEDSLRRLQLRDLCIAEGIGVITYYSLASGFLTGKYRSQADLGRSPRGQGVAEYLNARGLRILAALDAVAARHGAAPAEVALAWLIARPGVTAPIASATRPEQVDSLVRATQLSLQTEDIARLDAASTATG